MRVVSNTSPILNLAIIDRLSLLKYQAGVVLIPPAVLEELRVDEDRPGSIHIRNALESGWLRIEKPEGTSLLHLLQRELDKGEAHAISLALQVKADWTLLDEREARRVAKSLELKVTGVLGLLLRAWRQGNLSSLEDTIRELRDKAGFHLSRQIVEEILLEARRLGTAGR
ncbi:MAG: DUF3368 domain-containing protein [Methanosarcinales archaeon]|nr:MAG: DUF3368 domain-containing protein [Methanosarcinales archaeon]